MAKNAKKCTDVELLESEIPEDEPEINESDLSTPGEDEIEEGNEDTIPEDKDAKATTGPCEGSRFEVARQQRNDGDGWDYFWMLYAGNGKQIATSPVAFRRINDAKKVMRSLGAIAQDAPLVRLY